jgi:hypothetical protein
MVEFFSFWSARSDGRQRNPVTSLVYIISQGVIDDPPSSKTHLVWLGEVFLSPAPKWHESVENTS